MTSSLWMTQTVMMKILLMQIVDVKTQSSETWWPKIEIICSENVEKRIPRASQPISTSSSLSSPSAIGDHELICLDDSDDDTVPILQKTTSSTNHDTKMNLPGQISPDISGRHSSLLLDSGRDKKMTSQDIRKVFAAQLVEDSDCICIESDDDKDEKPMPLPKDSPRQLKNVSTVEEGESSAISPEKESISSDSESRKSINSHPFKHEIKASRKSSNSGEKMKVAVQEEKILELKDSQHGPSNKIAEPLVRSPKEKEVSKKRIKKLEICLTECAKQIKKFDEAEVNWDDDEDSSYLMTSKYKERYVKIYQKLAQINKTSHDLGRKTETKFVFNDSKYPSVNRKIEKYIDKEKIFPDFKDICSLIEGVNEKNKLSMAKGQVHAEAENIFKKLGNKLKSRRMADEADVIDSYISQNNGLFSDPADKDSQLEEKLEKQFRQGKKSFEKVFQDFSEKQISKKSEPKAVASDADESSSEDDDEEKDEESEKDYDDEGPMNPTKKVKLLAFSEASSSEEDETSSQEISYNNAVSETSDDGSNDEDF